MIPKAFGAGPTPFHLGPVITGFQGQIQDRLEGGRIDLFGLLRGGEGSIGAIISALLSFIFVIAGLIFFGAIIVSGFQFLTSTGDPKKTANAKGCLTNAVVGFLVIFVSWWLVQIIGVIFHLEIF